MVGIVYRGVTGVAKHCCNCGLKMSWAIDKPKRNWGGTSQAPAASGALHTCLVQLK